MKPPSPRSASTPKSTSNTEDRGLGHQHDAERGIRSGIPNREFIPVLDVSSARPTFVVSEPHQRAYLRSQVTAIRLLLALLVVGSMYAVLHDSDSQFGTNFREVLGSAPRWLVSAIISTCQLAVLVAAVLGFISQLVVRHFARVGRMLLAAAVCTAGLVAMSKLLGDSILPLIPSRSAGVAGSGLDANGLSGYGIGAAFPTTLNLGVIAAWMFVDRGQWSHRWRWIGRLVLVLAMAARLGVGLADPATIVMAIAMAAAASSLVQLILGAPTPALVPQAWVRSSSVWGTRCRRSSDSVGSAASQDSGSTSTTASS